MSVSIGTGMVALAIAGVIISVVSRLVPQRYGAAANGKSGGNGGGKQEGEYAVATQKDIRDLDLRISEMHTTLLERFDQSFRRVHERLDAREERCNERGQRIARMESQISHADKEINEQKNMNRRKTDVKTIENVGQGGA